MSTTDSFPGDFLLVLAVGGFICVMAWFFTRRLLQRSQWWRAAFCVLIGAAIAPTCFPILGGMVVAPAAFMLLLVSDGGKDALIGILYGAPPILLAAALVFAVWSFVTSRKHGHEIHVAEP
jgi:hypothetical protein